MGYMHIDNLYKKIEIMNFKECYALEKVHGTSTHVSWKPDEDKIIVYAGGMEHDTFIQLFDIEGLKEKFRELFDCDVTVYGEGYGGKCQKMSKTYGIEPRFIAFDVKVGTTWVSVPNAEDIATKLGLEFVPYEKVNTDLDNLNAERDRDSIVGERRGCPGQMREGVVLRPLEEMIKSNGSRVIVKHKRAEFMETKTPREVDPAKLKIMNDAKEVAEEWVVPMRLDHVLDNFEHPMEMESTRFVIKAMIEDVHRESEGEVEWSKAVAQAVGREAAKLFKARVMKI